MAKRAYKKVYIRKHFLEQSGTVLASTAGGISSALNGNLLVVTPVIPLLTFNAQITDLANTIIARVTDPSPSLEQDEISQSTIVYDSLDALADQVEMLANASDPGNVAAIESLILGIGFQVKSPHAKQEQTFAVIATDHGSATLTQHLPAKKKTRAIYAWIYTLTPSDANSWSTPVFTVESKVTLTGLTPDKRGYFKGAVLLPLGVNPVIDINDEQINWDPTIISGLIP